MTDDTTNEREARELVKKLGWLPIDPVVTQTADGDWEARFLVAGVEWVETSCSASESEAWGAIGTTLRAIDAVANERARDQVVDLRREQDEAVACIERGAVEIEHLEKVIDGVERERDEAREKLERVRAAWRGVDQLYENMVSLSQERPWMAVPTHEVEGVREALGVDGAGGIHVEGVREGFPTVEQEFGDPDPSRAAEDEPEAVTFGLRAARAAWDAGCQGLEFEAFRGRTPIKRFWKAVRRIDADEMTRFRFAPGYQPTAEQVAAVVKAEPERLRKMDEGE